MTIDTGDIHSRIVQLESAEKQLSKEVRVLDNRLDKSLLTLTHNVESLTQAIKALQEAQTQTVALQQSMILLQERASTIPELHREINRLTVERATDSVVLKGIRTVAGAILVVLVGTAATILFGVPTPIG